VACIRNRESDVDFSPTILAVVLALPVRYNILDGGLIAAGAQLKPDFLTLLHGFPVCLYFNFVEVPPTLRLLHPHSGHHCL
jgi:hypothetical protein